MKLTSWLETLLNISNRFLPNHCLKPCLNTNVSSKNRNWENYTNLNMKSNNPEVEDEDKIEYGGESYSDTEEEFIEMEGKITQTKISINKNAEWPAASEDASTQIEKNSEEKSTQTSIEENSGEKDEKFWENYEEEKIRDIKENIKNYESESQTYQKEILKEYNEKNHEAQGGEKKNENGENKEQDNKEKSEKTNNNKEQEKNNSNNNKNNEDEDNEDENNDRGRENIEDEMNFRRFLDTLIRMFIHYNYEWLRRNERLFRRLYPEESEARNRQLIFSRNLNRDAWIEYMVIRVRQNIMWRLENYTVGYIISIGIGTIIYGLLQYFLEDRIISKNEAIDEFLKNNEFIDKIKKNKITRPILYIYNPENYFNFKKMRNLFIYKGLSANNPDFFIKAVKSEWGYKTTKLFSKNPKKAAAAAASIVGWIFWNKYKK